MITGALILPAGILIGVILRSLPARRRGPKPVEAVCGCTHHHAMHDGQTGNCHAQVDEPTVYDRLGDPTSFRKGPVPVPPLQRSAAPH